MCGIAGWASIDGELDRDLVQRLGEALAHRGPDDAGLVVHQDGELSVGMASRRLAIVDLSEAGHMPMPNESGEVWLSFNGEIYNHARLREELVRRGHVYRSRTDTETILHAYEEHGLDFLPGLNGIFAFALHDRQRRRVVLATDRRGVKPLYYTWNGRRLLFASELKALLLDPSLPRVPDFEAIELYLALGFVPSPFTLLRHVRKLPPGSVAVLDRSGWSVTRYWRDAFDPDATRTRRDADLVDEIRVTVEAAVERQRMSDVPIGVLLSGGIDSSIVGTLTRRKHPEPLHTFTIGFRDATLVPADLNADAHLAREMARALGTIHHEIVLDNGPDLAERFARVVHAMDDPYYDPTVIAAEAICSLARAHGIKVVLAGDGGDELFGGYLHYLAAQSLERYARVPLLRPILALARPLTKGSVRRRLDDVVELPRLALPLRYLAYNGIFPAAERERLVPVWRANDDPAVSLVEQILAEGLPSGGTTFGDALAFADLKLWVDEHFNPRLDRMSMLNSVEARVPLQDDEVVQLALRLPLARKTRGHSTKALLKAAFADVLPAAVLAQPKRGFHVPRAGWLARGLQPVVAATLSQSRVERLGLLRWEGVRAILEACGPHCEGADPRLAARQWSLLVLQAWGETYLGPGTPRNQPLAGPPIGEGAWQPPSRNGGPVVVHAGTSVGSRRAPGETATARVTATEGT